jgi:hypothetical protein
MSIPVAAARLISIPVEAASSELKCKRRRRIQDPHDF